MHIEHGAHGGRTVVGTHNGARVVNTGRHGGYVQAVLCQSRRHSYYSPHLLSQWRLLDRSLCGYYYGGVNYYGYYPGLSTGAGFYGWAYNPWASPIAWVWAPGVGEERRGMASTVAGSIISRVCFAGVLVDRLSDRGELQAAYAGRRSRRWRRRSQQSRRWIDQQSQGPMAVEAARLKVAMTPKSSKRLPTK